MGGLRRWTSLSRSEEGSRLLEEVHKCTTGPARTPYVLACVGALSPFTL